ncbi:MAG: hypothetical protein WCI27_03215 [Candidatus Omnitrophota bacterium]
MGTNRMIKNRINRFFEVGAPHSRFSFNDGSVRFKCSSVRVAMKKMDIELLDDLEVRKEIERYKWIESEKFGRDIGMERASCEWLLLYADAWQKVHFPRKRLFGKSSGTSRSRQ